MAPSYASGTGFEPLIGETIGALLERIARELPDHPALISRHQGTRMTYAELDATADRLARGLMTAGLEDGDRVGIWAPNCAEWTLVQFATAKVGIDPRQHQPRVPADRARVRAEAVRAAGCSSARSRSSRRTTSRWSTRSAATSRRSSASSSSTRRDWDELLAEADGTDPEALRNAPAGLQFDDPINIQYTSGTTGFPKGATLSHHNILNNGFFVGELLRLHRGRPRLHPRAALPLLRHGHGQPRLRHPRRVRWSSRRRLRAGRHARGGRRRSAARRSTACRRCSSPSSRTRDFASFDLSSLRTGIMAGSPCPVEVMQPRRRRDAHGRGDHLLRHDRDVAGVDADARRRRARAPRLRPSGGCTRTSRSRSSTRRPDARRRRAASRASCCTRGYSVMLGYWDDAERTAEAIDAAGWMHTGDLATMDDEGYLNIVGRIKDMVIRGGENVYPREVEEFLYSHPAVPTWPSSACPTSATARSCCAWVRLTRGRDRHGGRGPRVLPGPHRALQGAALRAGSSTRSR